MRVIVCGDRNWTDYQKIYDRIKLLPNDTVIVEGAARGADQLAGVVAQQLKISLQVFPANWNLYGKRAGPLRNIEMLNTNPDLVIAFHSDIQNSKGTAHMIKIAKERGIPTELIC